MQKITTKNAWKLQIIDLLRPLCDKAGKDTLQIASTSIDISAKVYGIRVDDIHADGLKLASNMARVTDKQRPQDAGNTIILNILLVIQFFYICLHVKIILLLNIV